MKTIDVKKPKSESAPETNVPVSRAERTEERALFLPRSDIYESAEGLVILLDVPGVDEKDLAVDVENGVLTVQGRQRHEDTGARRLALAEYVVGDYRRSFVLGDELDPANIRAELRNGVLKILLPKTEEARPRRIPISVS